MIAGYVGNREALDKAMTQSALAYSQQNGHDYAELQKPAHSRRVRDAKVF
jgi:hypothetical protein